MIKVGIAGAGGKMGTVIAGLVEKDRDLKLSLAVETAGNKAVGGMVAGCKITDSLKAGLNDIDVYIDFTVPAATIAAVNTLASAGKPVVIGTTGLTATEITEIEVASKKIPVVFSSNYSVGVNVMWKIVRDAVQAMKENYDIDIVESHHRMKKDAPSGTAVTTAKVIMEAKGLDYESNVVYGRSGRENDRPRDQLGILAVRGGGVIGEHTVILADMGDKLEIKHTAFSRETFAAGAIKAAKFLIGKKPGLYSMNDVLGL